MTKYIVKRLLLMIPTLLGVAVLIFFLMRVVPGDIVELRFAGESSFAQKESLDRSEEHTSELQSLAYLVCRLLLEKKKAVYLQGEHVFLIRGSSTIWCYKMNARYQVD